MQWRTRAGRDFETTKSCVIEQPIASDRTSPAGAVLVSGASFAGLATAYWMNRLGYRVTLIEVARALRKGGTPVDIEGPAIDALADMGMIDAVRTKALPPRVLEFNKKYSRPRCSQPNYGEFNDRNRSSIS